MLETQCLPLDQLLYFLDRHRKSEVDIQDFNFQTALKKIVDELKEFIPSEGIYILLDDPMQFSVEAGPKNLIYVAGYGEKAQQIIGLKTVSSQGLISQTYRTGVQQIIRPQTGESVVLDKIHLPKEIKDVICIPLKISTHTIGVVVMFCKQDPMGYSMKDVRMINIFCGYLSMSIQSAIDTKKHKELTKRDNLTGLYNDRYFHSQLEKEIFSADRANSDLILLFMDLDNFKMINDQYGHMVGSQTLKEIGFVLREAVQIPNATLARYGGDEYVCILPGLTIEKAIDVANTIREKIIEKMFMIDSGYEDGSFISFKGKISASVGLSSLRDQAMQIEDPRERKNNLVRMADRAMYDAKEQGKNRVCVAKAKS